MDALRCVRGLAREFTRRGRAVAWWPFLDRVAFEVAMGPGDPARRFSLRYCPCPHGTPGFEVLVLAGGSWAKAYWLEARHPHATANAFERLLASYSLVAIADRHQTIDIERSAIA